MAVSIDTVYQRVLTVLNKEQRGYITPQEFNTLANQAQLDLFEQYFYDINQFGRMHGNDTEYSDMLNILNEKINLFERTLPLSFNEATQYFLLPGDLYRVGTVIFNNTTENNFGITSTEQIEAERINKNEFLYINSSPLTKPSNMRPIYISDINGIKVYGNTVISENVDLNYIKKPAKVEWAYTIVFEEPLYNATNSVDFELHPSEETELVIKILQLSGLLIKDYNVYQSTVGEETRNTQQEKS
jgi:hypothetical protein